MCNEIISACMDDPLKDPNDILWINLIYMEGLIANLDKETKMFKDYTYMKNVITVLSNEYSKGGI